MYQKSGKWKKQNLFLLKTPKKKREKNKYQFCGPNNNSKFNNFSNKQTKSRLLKISFTIVTEKNKSDTS